MKLDKNRISDLDGYLYKMQKSMIDKMFFVDKIFEPVDCIVDFGCANGELIKMLSYYFDEYRYYGYDISADMIAAARQNVPGAVFTDRWDQLDVPFGRSLLNLSSVMHEVYSYSTPDEIGEFWDKVFDSGFRYVTVRDMCVSDDTMRPADPSDITRVRSNAAYAGKLADYESIWGEIKTQRDLVHYLLKYSYTENWYREVREDYLGLSAEALMSMVPDTYRVTYREHYTLPFVAWQVKRDFGIELSTPTHIKLIMESSR